MVVLVEGLNRFFLKHFHPEVSYLKATVQVFHDFSLESPETLDILEQSVFRMAKITLQVSITQHFWCNKHRIGSVAMTLQLMYQCF